MICLNDHWSKCKKSFYQRPDVIYGFRRKYLKRKYVVWSNLWTGSICSRINMFLIFFFIKSYMHFCQSLKNITFLWFEDFPYFLLSDWLITCFIILTYKHSSHTCMYISIRCSTIQTTMGITGVILSWRRSAIYGQFVNVGTQWNKN